MILHQIFSHHFFQAQSNPERIEPLDLIEIFNLEPGINYMLKTREIEYYPFCSANTLDEQEPIEIIRQITKNSDYVLNLISKLDRKMYYHIKLMNLNYKKKIIFNKVEFEKTNFTNTYYNLDKINKYIELDE